MNAVPYRGGEKGADSGIDGIIYFEPEGKTTEKAIVSVKGGDKDRRLHHFGWFYRPDANRSSEGWLLRDAVRQVPED